MAEVDREVEQHKAALPGTAQEGGAAGEQVAVHASKLRELAEGTPEGAMGLGVLLDMPVKVTVEVGRVAVSLGELCRLGPGSLLRLDREAHQPADILVNGKVVARGEIVTINDSYGIRITDVSS